MQRNDTFKEMLSDFRPDLGDSEEYMKRLASRLEATSTAKSLIGAERRRSRNLLVAAFAIGGIAGTLMTVYLLLHPVVPTMHDGQHGLYLMEWLSRNKNLILAFSAAASTSIFITVVRMLWHSIRTKDFSL